jgi:hypothetical protein
MTSKDPNFTSKTYYKNVYTLSHFNPHEESPRYRIFLGIGSRGRGKTYSAKNYIANKIVFDPKFRKFAWIRLTDRACENLLENDGSTFFESTILEKKNLSVTSQGSDVFFKRSNEKDDKFRHRGKVLSLQNYHNWKGNQFEEYDVIVIDELVRAENERRTFNIPKAFVNTLETILRERTNVVILIYANAINEMQEIKQLFGFMPLPGKFGVYKLFHNRAIIEYLDDSRAWKQRKAQTIAGRLGQNMTEFSNVHDDPLAELDVFIPRAKVSKKVYIMSLKINRSPMWFDMFKNGDKYFIDYKTYSPEKLSRNTYALHRELVNNVFVFSPEIFKFIKEAWDNNLLQYANNTIFEYIQELVIHNKPLR